MAEATLRALIRSILVSDGVLPRSDSEQTVENSLEPLSSPADDPFTTKWYASLIPHKTPNPLTAPDTQPGFFHVRDAQHTSLFNPATPSGGCREADLLYMAIAFLQRSLDDLHPLITSQQLSMVWKSVKGVSEMLHTRYDLLCALRRSRDDEHVRCLEMFMQPPSGDGAASERVHREICRVVGRKRPREVESGDEPPQARVKTAPDVDDDCEIVSPVKRTQVKQIRTPDKKGTKDGNKAGSSPAKKSALRTSRSETVGDAPKPKRSAPANASCSPIVSRTRSADVTKRLRSSSTPAKTKSGSTVAKAGRLVSTPRNKQVDSIKKTTPKKEALTKKTTPAKNKVETETKNTTAAKKKVAANTKKAAPAKKIVGSEKKLTPRKLALADKNNAEQHRASTKSLPGTSGESSRQAGRDKKPAPTPRVNSSRRATLARAAEGKSQATLEDMPSVKKSENKAVSTGQSEADKTESKAHEEKTQDVKITPAPHVNGAKAANINAADEIEIVHVKMNKKEASNEEHHEISTRNTVVASQNNAAHSPKPSLEHPMTNFSFVIRGDGNREMKSSFHMYAGYQWRVVVYPGGDKHMDWMSVYLECRGPGPSSRSELEVETPSPTDRTETGETKSGAWAIPVKFSVRVLRTDSPVTKSVLEGKGVIIDDVDGLLSSSKVSPDGNVAQAGLLSDFVGAISHNFSPLSDHVGFSRLAPTSCLKPGMYADKDKNIVLILFMCVE